MTIEMLDKGLILVSLGREDMRRYALGESDCGGMSVESGLKSLLYRVSEVCGLDYRGKSYLIEVLPAKVGCLMIISIRPVSRRRRIYRIKRSRAMAACVFFDTDAMLDYLRCTDRRTGAAVYRYRERYVLLSNLPVGDNGALGEYGDLYALSLTQAARIREHGALLWEEKLQCRHINGGAVTVRNTAPGDACR